MLSFHCILFDKAKTGSFPFLEWTCLLALCCSLIPYKCKFSWNVATHLLLPVRPSSEVPLPLCGRALKQVLGCLWVARCGSAPSRLIGCSSCRQKTLFLKRHADRKYWTLWCERQIKGALSCMTMSWVSPLKRLLWLQLNLHPESNGLIAFKCCIQHWMNVLLIH